MYRASAWASSSTRACFVSAQAREYASRFGACSVISFSKCCAFQWLAAEYW